ncbi:MAG: exosortase V [Sphingopyxis sp.]|uniref:exosortase n=1 Tax=Sphingopyxis sp. TaxID=1908224 RepID=UPI002AB80063|nr:exosortase [Sphingopyxis sp.]MDZ3833678.1 exosortase V [Sphingopyxis sp.]
MSLTRTAIPTEAPAVSREPISWPLIAGVLLIGIPTVITLAQQSWSTEAGSHGPIVLATGAWLIWHRGLLREPLAGIARLSWLAFLLLGLALASWIFGRAYDLLLLEGGGLYGAVMAIIALRIGWKRIFSNLFPFTYMAFLVPIPGWVLDYVTAPLQQLVSIASSSLLSMLGYPVFREGVVITVAQYQLLVEEACAGMNSLMGLMSISMFYIYLLHRASWRHAALLALCIIPIAVAVNIFRVSILILLTYHFGDAVAQGFMHATTGMVLFGVALALMVSADKLLRLLLGSAQVRA